MIKDIVTAKHNQLIEKANKLCTQLYTLTADIQDIFETVEFIQMQRLRVPENCIKLTDGSNVMKLDISDDGLSLDFYNVETNQRCTYSDGDFTLQCSEQTDTRFRTKKVARYINFNNEYDFHTVQCCKLMQEFFDMFPSYKQLFINGISAM